MNGTVLQYYIIVLNYNIDIRQLTCVSGLSERPLKLVLKVAGNEVTTGSPSLERVYDDSVDYDKHKDKKKKKKKKDEKDRASPPVSPVDKKKKVRYEYCVFVLNFFCLLANFILINIVCYVF